MNNWTESCCVWHMWEVSRMPLCFSKWLLVVFTVEIKYSFVSFYKLPVQVFLVIYIIHIWYICMCIFERIDVNCKHIVMLSNELNDMFHVPCQYHVLKCLLILYGKVFVFCMYMFIKFLQWNSCSRYLCYFSIIAHRIRHNNTITQTQHRYNMLSCACGDE